MHIFITLILLFSSVSLYAQEDSVKPSDFPVASFKALPLKKVSKVIDEKLILMENGEIVRLDGIETPDEYQVAIKEKLEEILTKKDVRIFTPKNLRGDTINRMDQRLAQIVTNDDIWVQKKLIEEGLARVFPSPYVDAALPLLLKAEESARSENKGLWGNEAFQIKTPTTVSEDVYNMQIIEGEVISIASVRGTLYLNFGSNWRDDFTVSIEAPLRKKMSRKKINPLSWQNKKIRVRGFVENYNGTLIKLLYPEQIELIDQYTSTQPKKDLVKEGLDNDGA